MNATASSGDATTPAAGKRTNPILRWTGRILLGLLALIVVLVASGASYEAIMAAGDASRYPARGQRVDVGGYRLHISCIGDGSPTVVLDAGQGGFSLDWSLIQPELATTTRVCAYDRAGYGWSDPSPQPRTPRQIAEELHTLLGNAGIEGPYVLVGHSAGGKHVRLYATRHPQDVAGMVLVDARTEYVDANRSPEALAAEHKQQRRFQRTICVAARIGLVRPFWAALWPKVWPATQNLSAETRAEIGVLQARSQQIKTVLSEDAFLTQDNSQLNSAGPPRQRAAHRAGSRAECRAGHALAGCPGAVGPRLLERQTHHRQRQRSLHPLGTADVGGGRHTPGCGGGACQSAAKAIAE